MSQLCDICGKGHQVGCHVSHAHNRTKKVSRPNLHRVRAWHQGAVHVLKVCTRCLRSGFIQKTGPGRAKSLSATPGSTG